MKARYLKTTDHSIKSQLTGLKPEQALCEYIWNGFDANATEISVKIEINPMQGISSITISDNGDGIDIDDLENTLDLFLDSKKKNVSKPTTRGKKGRGRFSFIKFCEQATWNTYDGKNAFDFTIDSGRLSQYEPEATAYTKDKSKGTTVTFVHIKGIDFNYFNDVVVPYLKNEFTWLLVSNEKLEFMINGLPLVHSSYHSVPAIEAIEDSVFDLNSVIWDSKQNSEKSLIYFINSTQEIVHKELSELNLKGFFCSAYVRSDWFDDFGGNSDLLSGDKHTESDVFVQILANAKSRMRQEYIKFRNSAADSLIEQYLAEGVFPEMKGDNVVLNEFHREQLISTIKTIYEAEPSVFSKQLNKSQKKILIKLLDRIVQSNRLSELFDVLDGVVSLTEDDMCRISNLLQRTSLENITKTVEHIRDRLDIIQNFKSLIYQHQRFALEVPHIQKCIESNLWLFGEKYHLLTSEEDKFEHALRNLLEFHKRDNYYNKKPIVHPDKDKEMDLFIAQKGFRVGDDDKKYFHHVVIELKRPSIKLGDKELQQIKTYKNVIANEPQFQDENSLWDFVLIGNEISESKITAADLRSDLESNKIHGEPGLVQKTGNYRIIVKTWKQILNEFELRYNDISNRLSLQELEIVSETPEQLTGDIKKLSESAL
ncbi:ATP-binding protein [Shewanella sp. SM34]|uniref:ATP-binding protein n=1 Tax=unclassified Shewanella TaxID=196818 RepID=UPI0021D99CE8|nr:MULTISPECIES: ATP-binding protein [unclassified Shewanella]MCU8057610.1 ATP-binding protein [Shewanella sp. SM35]MCU8065927.1 ATP-binding protein [Shewanella sp. SM34]